MFTALFTKIHLKGHHNISYKLQSANRLVVMLSAWFNIYSFPHLIAFIY